VAKELAWAMGQELVPGQEPPVHSFLWLGSDAELLDVKEKVAVQL
jgi:hypothetical protein